MSSMSPPRQSAFRCLNSSLHPPAFPLDQEGGAEINWVLLDWCAYVAERHNSTTAFSETWDGKQIQVTLCLALPPRVSYLCVFCPGLDHTVFPLEPRIIAMEDDLLLLRIIATYRSDILKDGDYYIYQAADETRGGAPSLKRLPRPPRRYVLDSHNVGILRCCCGTSHHHQWRDTAGDFYIVAGLCRADDNIDPMEFVLCLHNSKFPTSWSTHNISLDKQRYGDDFHHVNSKVISIGHAGTMGFVDLWRGILFCDVLNAEQLKASPGLRYVRLPQPPLQGGVRVSQPADARRARDIAVIEQGRTIRYMEVQVHWKPCPTFSGHYLKDGWVCRTWSRSVSADCSDTWDLDRQQESSDIPVDSNPHFELLPKMVNQGGMPLKPFKGLIICQPTLSLNDDGIVCFMIKMELGDGKAWVISVDTKNNVLQGVAEFAAERTVGLNFAYMHSRISKYLTTSGTESNLKRPGLMLLGSWNKRPRFWMSMPPWDDEQKQHDVEMEGCGDYMLLG